MKFNINAQAKMDAAKDKAEEAAEFVKEELVPWVKYSLLILFLAFSLFAGSLISTSFITGFKHDVEFNVMVLQDPQSKVYSESFSGKDAQRVCKDLGCQPFTTGNVWGKTPRLSCVEVRLTPYVDSQATFFLDRPTVRAEDCWSGKNQVELVVGRTDDPQLVFAQLVAVMVPMWNSATENGFTGMHTVSYDVDVLKRYYPDEVSAATVYAEKQLKPTLINSSPKNNREVWNKFGLQIGYGVLAIVVFGIFALVDIRMFKGWWVTQAHRILFSVPNVLGQVFVRDTGSRQAAQYMFSIVWLVILGTLLFQKYLININWIGW